MKLLILSLIFSWICSTTSAYGLGPIKTHRQYIKSCDSEYGTRGFFSESPIDLWMRRMHEKLDSSGSFSDRAYRNLVREFPRQSSTQLENLNHKLINNSLFILPANDGEAMMSLDILKRIGAPYVQISNQGWGAVLDRESIPLEVLDRVDNIYVFEMPSLKQEQLLTSLGFNVVVIDHHDYKKILRLKPESSIEQLAKILGYKLNEYERAIAANDHDYIKGMKSLGLTETQIRAVREYDLSSQGRSYREIERGAKDAQKAIKKLSKLNDFYIIEKSNADVSSIYQELGIQSLDGSFNAIQFASHRISFSGDKNFVSMLMDIDYASFGYKDDDFNMFTAGGGSYFNLKILTYDQEITKALKERILDMISIFEKSRI